MYFGRAREGIVLITISINGAKYIDGVLWLNV
jgi:hypothetical protein